MQFTQGQIFVLYAVPLFGVACNVGLYIALFVYVAGRLDRLTEAVHQLSERITRIEERMTRLEERMTLLEYRLSMIESRVTRLETTHA